MKIVIERSVTVITPSIGSPKLADAVRSVQSQTYKNIEHLVVIDGKDYTSNVWDVLENECGQDKYPTVLSLPYNTGKTGGNFYGHRIYAGVPHLLNSDYVFFLDEDNWYETNHVQSLVNVLDKGYNFAYSFRQIYDENKNYLLHDNCEALGKWPIYFTLEKDPQYLIDTSAFAFNREFLQATCHLWHSGWGGDRQYLYSVKDRSTWECSYQHSLCYRLDGNPGSVNAEFFLRGNEVQLEHYNGRMPWLART